MTELSRATRLTARLAACLADPVTRARALAARSRPELVDALAAAESHGGEAALDEPVLFAVLGTRRTGLEAAEASRRLTACGPNQIERVARHSLASRFAAQFTSFFALLLWIGGGLAYLAALPELAWAIMAVIAVNGVFSFFQEYRAERTVEALRALLPRRRWCPFGESLSYRTTGCSSPLRTNASRYLTPLGLRDVMASASGASLRYSRPPTTPTRRRLIRRLNWL
jgi:hypothetical protein